MWRCNDVTLACEGMNAVLYKVTHLKIGDHVWVMQLPEDLDLSQRACPQDVSIRIIVLNLELLNCHDRLGPHNSALHDQACPTAPCLAQVLQHTVQYSTVQYITVQHSTAQYSTVQYGTV